VGNQLVNPAVVWLLAGLGYAAVMVLAVGLGRAAGKHPGRHAVDADRDALLRATATVTPIDEGRRWRADT
jgi:hypothetical protein